MGAQDEKITRRLVVVAPPGRWEGAAWLRGFQLRRTEDLSEPRDIVGVDCVAIAIADRVRVARIVAAVELARRDDPVALILVGPIGPNVGELLVAHDFDGYVDTSWPPALAAACVEMAVRHAQTDRNVVEIQRVILAHSRDEADRLFDLAVHDDLTGLHNRRNLLDLLDRVHERAARQQRRYSVVFLDLDDLKQINTRHGHTGGSRALKALSETLTSLLRASDLAGRFGGDEFVVLLPECDERGALVFAQRVLTVLAERRFDLGSGGSSPLTVSIGVASFPAHGEEAHVVLQSADRALLRAKALGKNRALSAEQAEEAA